MKRFSCSRIAFWLTICLLANGATTDAAEGLKLQAQLIWGTNEEQSSDPKHKLIGPELAAKLKESPYRWKNYFEINRVIAEVPLNEKKTFKMSEPCQLDIKNVGGDRVEINFIGQGTPVSLHKEKVAPDWPLILSGNAKNGNAWMVVIKKVVPTTAKPDTNNLAKPEMAKPVTPKQN